MERSYFVARYTGPDDVQADVIYRQGAIPQGYSPGIPAVRVERDGREVPVTCVEREIDVHSPLGGIVTCYLKSTRRLP